MTQNPVMSTQSQYPAHDSLETSSPLLEELTRQARELASLLIREHSALQQRAYAKIRALTARKQEILRALEHAHQTGADQIEKLRAEVSTSARRSGEFNAPPHRSADWEELHVLLAQCQVQNCANGELISVLSRHTRGIISLIQGVQTRNMPYDSRGQRSTSDGSSYRIIV